MAAMIRPDSCGGQNGEDSDHDALCGRAEAAVVLCYPHGIVVRCGLLCLGREEGMGLGGAQKRRGRRAALEHLLRQHHRGAERLLRVLKSSREQQGEGNAAALASRERMSSVEEAVGAGSAG